MFTLVDKANHAAHHLLAGVEVRYHPIAERSDCLNVLVRLALHGARLPPDGDQLVVRAIDGHYGRLIHDYFVIVDDYGIRRAKVYCEFLGKK